MWNDSCQRAEEELDFDSCQSAQLRPAALRIVEALATGLATLSGILLLGVYIICTVGTGMQIVLGATFDAR